LSLKVIVIGIPRRKQILSSAAIIGVLAIFLLLIFMDTYFFYVILLIETGLSSFIIYDFRKLYIESQRTYSFVKILKIDSLRNKISLVRNVKVTRGKFYVIGRRTPIYIYDSDSVYEPKSGSFFLNEIDLNNVASSYVIAASKWGTGFGCFDAYRVEDKEYEGVVFFVIRKTLFKFSTEPNEIRFQFKGCAIETIIKPLNYGFEAATYMYGCNKEYRALLKITCHSEFYGRKIEVKSKVLAISQKFVKRTVFKSEISNNTFLFITFPRRVSLIDLLKIIGSKLPAIIISGEAYSPCKIIIEAYKRFKRKAKAEAKLIVMGAS